MPDLPSEPSLQQLRHQARDLQRAVRRGDRDALAEVAGRHPDGRPDGAAAAAFSLSAAQLVVARRYDFPSWVRLRRYVEVVERYSRFPGRMTADPENPGNPADEFLRLACLYYEDDEPGRWTQARQILLDHPEITRLSVCAAAAAADLPRLAAHLAADRRAAARPGGPFRCEPLFYLAYARHDPAIGEAVVLGAARMLLHAGADPNAGYLWHGLPTPFTVLTGVFGEGELGPVRQPRHRLGRTARRAWLRRERQGQVRRARRRLVADRAARRGDGRPPGPGQELAQARRRSRYPRSALRFHPARLGPLFRAGAAGRAVRAADRTGGALISPGPDG
jgi:hypothetical protein